MGGLTLTDFFQFNAHSHVKLVSASWDGPTLLDSLDRVVTYHGTIGVEATMMEMPVLVADRTWYSDLGFVKTPQGIKEYLELLSINWWSNMKLEINAKNARIFAGAYWGRPDWQKQFVFPDDSDEFAIYTRSRGLFSNRKEISRDLSLIREWYYAPHKHYHSYKMLQADNYVVRDCIRVV